MHSLYSLVLSPQFSGPAGLHLSLCSDLCPHACMSSRCSHPPSPWVQSVLDRHVLFPLLTISNVLWWPDQQIFLSHPPCLVSQHLSPFALTVQFLVVDITSPGPPSLHCPLFLLYPAPMLGLLPFPKLLVLIWLPPALCILINFLPITDTAHRWTRNKALRCPGLQRMQTAGLF